MSASTAILLLVILVLCVFAGRKMIAAFTGKGGCHGGGGSATKHVKVADTNESHYPYSQDIQVGGMTCDSCARNVENALNSLEGTWASVDLASGTAHVLSKAPLDPVAIRDAVVGAGYYAPRVQASAQEALA